MLGGQRRNLHFARVSSPANKLTRNYVFSDKLVYEMPRRAISMPPGDLDSFGLELNIFEIRKIAQNPQLGGPPQSEPRQLRENCPERLRARAGSTEPCCRRYRPPLESYRKKLSNSPSNCFFHFQNCPKLSETFQNCPKISNFRNLTSGSALSHVDVSAYRKS